MFEQVPVHSTISGATSNGALSGFSVYEHSFALFAHFPSTKLSFNPNRAEPSYSLCQSAFQRVTLYVNVNRRSKQFGSITVVQLPFVGATANSKDPPVPSEAEKWFWQCPVSEEYWFAPEATQSAVVGWKGRYPPPSVPGAGPADTWFGFSMCTLTVTLPFMPDEVDGKEIVKSVIFHGWSGPTNGVGSYAAARPDARARVARGVLKCMMSFLFLAGKRQVIVGSVG